MPSLLSSLARLLLEGPSMQRVTEGPPAQAGDGVLFQVIIMPPPPESAGSPAGVTTRPDGR